MDAPTPGSARSLREQLHPGLHSGARSARFGPSHGSACRQHTPPWVLRSARNRVLGSENGLRIGNRLLTTAHRRRRPVHGKVFVTLLFEPPEQPLAAGFRPLLALYDLASKVPQSAVTPHGRLVEPLTHDCHGFAAARDEILD